MPFEPMSVAELTAIDWIPQAILDRPIEGFRDHGLTYHEDEDGLDVYRGVFGRLDGAPVAVKSYPGFPDGTVELFAEPGLTDPDAIDALVRAAAGAFGLADGRILWRRGDGGHVPAALRERIEARGLAG